MTNAGRTHTGSSIPPIETGSFSLRNGEETNFIGSASGIFFVHTVFKAFSELSRNQQQQGVTPAIDSPEASVFVGDNDRQPLNDQNVFGTDQQETSDSVQNSQVPPDQLRHPRQTLKEADWLNTWPTLQQARDLLMEYFKQWHPQFPFLHGPAFLVWVDSIYQRDADALGYDQRTGCTEDICRRAIFQCILTVAGSGQSRTERTSHRREGLPLSDLLDLAMKLSVRPVTVSLQALLAIELYLITSLSLRSASIVHGILVRAIYHSGYHRCPYRYSQLPHGASREIRKRIFWSAYVMDRYLSQALGIPLGIQDAEVDVCLPASELHTEVKPSKEHDSDAAAQHSPDVLAHLPSNHPSYPMSWRQTGDLSTPDSSTATQSTRAATNADALASRQHSQPTQAELSPAELVLTYQVQLSQLQGELMALFHGSIHTRQMTREKIQSLTSRLHAWWNNLPQSLEGHPDRANHQPSDEEPSQSVAAGVNYHSRFTLAYHYTLLLLNRPFLSLPRGDPDFQESIQNAINASREIARTLNNVASDTFLLSWPMTLSAAWMSGLVLLFACLLKLLPLDKASRDVECAMKVLHRLGEYWTSSSHCHAALERLLLHLKQRDADGLGSMSLLDAADTNISLEAAVSLPVTSQPGMAVFSSQDLDPVDHRGKRQRIGPGASPSEWRQSRPEASVNITQPFARQDRAPVPAYTDNNFGLGTDTTWGDGVDYLPQDTGLLQLNDGGIFADVSWEAYLDGCIPSFDL